MNYCNFEIIASPIWEVETSFFPSDKMSLVLRPSFNTDWTAFSTASAYTSDFVKVSTAGAVTLNRVPTTEDFNTDNRGDGT